MGLQILQSVYMMPTDERDLVINKGSGKQHYWFTLRNNTVSSHSGKKPNRGMSLDSTFSELNFPVSDYEKH